MRRRVSIFTGTEISSNECAVDFVLSVNLAIDILINPSAVGIHNDIGASIRARIGYCAIQIIDQPVNTCFQRSLERQLIQTTIIHRRVQSSTNTCKIWQLLMTYRYQGAIASENLRIGCHQVGKPRAEFIINHQ